MSTKQKALILALLTMVGSFAVAAGDARRR